MKKRLLSFVLIATMIFTNTLLFADEIRGDKPGNIKFTDVSKHWAEEAINQIVDKAAFADKDGKFQPNKKITRSEFVLMLHKALDINIKYFKAPDIREHFDDVRNEDKYAMALYDLVTVNIIDVKDHFDPNATLSMEEMVHYIINAFRYQMGDSFKMIKIGIKPFADQEKVNPLYSGEIAIAEYYGFVVRPANNMFYPKHDSTRAQAATMIYRLVKQLEKESVQVSVTPGIEVKDGLIKMKLTITNNSKAPVVIKHSSGQQVDFKLLDAKMNELYTWSADKLFIAALTETVIKPGESAELSGEVEKALLDDMKVKAAYMKAYIIGESDSFKINPNGYQVEIK